jgi:hypothetical protein
MISATRSAKQDPVSCAMRLKEVTRSGAAVPEATDSDLYFCGLAGYQQWKEQQAQGAEPRDRARLSVRRPSAGAFPKLTRERAP